jgi:flagellar biosynthesis GTPase FlhF
MFRIKAVTCLGALIALGMTPLHAAASQRGAQQQGRGQAQQQQQQQLQQQRLQQLEQSLQQTEWCAKLHQMDQDMARQMERIREVERFRDHQRIRDMGKSLAQMAQELHGATLQLRDRERDQQRIRDQELERDMERLRQHVQDMSGRLEEGLKIMERLQQRLRVLQPSR